MATLDRLAPPAPAPAAPAWTPRRAIAAAFIAATAIALLQVLQSSSFANTGAKMQKLEAQRADLTAQIKQMESEVAALSSLDRVERGARDRLGMVPARRFDFVSVDVESPSGPLLPRPLIHAVPDDQPQPEPWWQSLLKSLPFH
jgi:cell division protein FtsL